MSKGWSISTTIRDPYKNIHYLNLLSNYEGQTLNKEITVSYFLDLIRHKLYKPNILSEQLKSKYQNKDIPFSNEDMEEIISKLKYSFNNKKGAVETLSNRGLQALKNLIDFKFIQIEKNKEIIITEKGYNSLYSKENFEKELEDSLIKWEREDYENKVQPFLDTLYVIQEINEHPFEVNGISKLELGVFLTTLIDSKDRNLHLIKILKLRWELGNNSEQSKEIREKHFINHLSKFYQNNDIEYLRKKIRNSKDYGDVIFRYFSCTSIFFINKHGYLDTNLKKEEGGN